jgi:drug/metabolite transporter (DMT)-like permease
MRGSGSQGGRCPSRSRLVHDVVQLLVLGLLGVTLNQFFFIVGLSRTSVAHAAILIGLTPIQVLIIAALRGQERITARKAVGMAIALAGVAVLKAFEPAAGAGATWLGDFFILLDRAVLRAVHRIRQGGDRSSTAPSP